MPAGVRVSVRRGLGRQFEMLPGVKKRLRNPVKPIGDFLADRVMRNGPGGVFDSFVRQAELPLDGGSTPWKQSKRALRVQAGLSASGTDLTLVDSGEYRRAWLAEGPGSVTEIERKSVTVGINPEAFPQVFVFQAEGPTGPVAQRRIVVSKGMLERFEAAMLDYIVRGSRPS